MKSNTVVNVFFAHGRAMFALHFHCIIVPKICFDELNVPAPIFLDASTKGQNYNALRAVQKYYAHDRRG